MSARAQNIAAIALLILAPLILFAPALLFGKTLHPWDPAQFAPAFDTLDDAQRAQATAEPRNFDVTEIPGLVVPEMQLARQEIAEGRFPGWNPYARFGAPLFGNGLAAMGNPLNALFLCGLDPRKGLAWRDWFAFASAGLLAFAFFRRLGLGHAAACFGGLVFQLGGTLAANGPFYMRLDALVWLPGSLHAVLAIARASNRSPARAAIGLACCTALTLLAGFPPYAVASFLLVGLFAACLLVERAQSAGGRAALTTASWMLIGVLLGTAFAAFQLAPMFAFFPESNRQLQPTTNAILSQGFDLGGLLGYLLPTPFGAPGDAALPATHSPLAHLLWMRRDPATGSLQYPLNYVFTEYAVFPGTLALLLMGFGVLHLRQRVHRLLAACALPILVLSIAPSWLGFAYHLPVVASVQPMRLLAPTALVMAFLAALGFEQLVRGIPRGRLVVVSAFCLALAAFVFLVYGMRPLHNHGAVLERLWQRFAGPDRPTLDIAAVHALITDPILTAANARLQANLWGAAWSWLAVALWFAALVATSGRALAHRLLLALGIVATMVELLWFAMPLNASRELIDNPTATPIHEFLREQNRNLAEAGGITIARAAKVTEDPLILTPGLLFPLRIRDLNSYAFVDGRSHRPFLALYGQDQMIRSYWPRTFPDDARLELPFFDLCGLRYLVSTVPLEHAGVRVGPTRVGPHDTPFFVYRRDSALPRAFVVHRREVLPDDDATVRALIAPDFDPRGAVLLTEDQASLLPAPAEDAGAEPSTRLVRFVEDDPNHLTLEVEDGPPGYLLCCDAALRGWTATVSGASTPIARGDLFLRAIALPRGAQRVEFRYSPPGLIVGVTISLLAVLIALFLDRRAAHSSRRLLPVDDPAL